MDKTPNPSNAATYVFFKKISLIISHNDSFVYDLENEPRRNHCCNHSNASQTVYSISYICL